MKLDSKFVWERFGSPEPVEGQPRLKSIEFLNSIRLRRINQYSTFVVTEYLYRFN